MDASVPANWGFIQVDVDLLGFKIFFDTPGAEFPAKAGLLIRAKAKQIAPSALIRVMLLSGELLRLDSTRVNESGKTG